MRRKFTQQGLVVVTVSIDPADDKSRVDDANAVLQKMKPPFVNLLLDEQEAVWKKKLDFSAAPCYFVFDRQGRWVRIRGSDHDNDELLRKLDDTIARMLNEK